MIPGSLDLDSTIWCRLRSEVERPKRMRLSALTTDSRHAYRRIRAQPQAAAVAAAMVAVAVGASAAMFTLVDALALRPVPFREPDRLAHVMAARGGAGRTTSPIELFGAWRRSRAFEVVHGAAQGGATIEGGLEPITRAGAYVTPGTFEMLGTSPLIGRTFHPEEGRPGTNRIVILSEGLWRSSFGAQRDILGVEVPLSGVAHIVVGVMPDEFRFPFHNTAFWRPMDFEALTTARDRKLNRPMVVARFARGVPDSEVERLATETIRATPPGGQDQQALLRPLAAGFLDSYSRSAVAVFVGGVALLFVVLCANTGNLALARATARQADLRMCTALGATRGRLLRQVFLETLIVGLVATVVGVWLAAAFVAAARAYLPDAFILRTLNPLDVDTRAVLVAAAAGLVATLLAGLPPAWLSTRSRHLVPVASQVGGHSERRLTRGLLVGEIAAATALLLAAVLLVRSFEGLVSADRGLRPEGVISGYVTLPAHRFTDAASRYAVAAELDATLRALPGVERAGLSYGMPPDSGRLYLEPVTAEGATNPGSDGILRRYSVTGEFFDLYGIDLLDGRPLGPQDGPGDAVISQKLRDRLFPGGPAVGRTFTIAGSNESFRVVGVSAEVHGGALEGDDPEFYTPLYVPTAGGLQPTILATGQIMFGVRCGDACPPVPVIRERVRSVSPHLVIAELASLEALYRQRLARPRATAGVGVSLAAVALGATAGGLFSVLSILVGRRRREFGVRAALGASSANLRTMVLLEGARAAVVGVGIGLLLGALLARSLASVFFGVNWWDPVSWALVLLTIAVVVLLGSLWPAQRAGRTDPVALMRHV